MGSALAYSSVMACELFFSPTRGPSRAGWKSLARASWASRSLGSILTLYCWGIWLLKFRAAAELLRLVATGEKMGSRNKVGPPLPTAAEDWKPAKSGMGTPTPYEVKEAKGAGCGWNMPLLFDGWQLFRRAEEQKKKKRPIPSANSPGRISGGGGWWCFASERASDVSLNFTQAGCRLVRHLHDFFPSFMPSCNTKGKKNAPSPIRRCRAMQSSSECRGTRWGVYPRKYISALSLSLKSPPSACVCRIAGQRKSDEESTGGLGCTGSFKQLVKKELVASDSWMLDNLP